MLSRAETQTSEDTQNYHINAILIFSNETRLYVFNHFDPNRTKPDLNREHFSRVPIRMHAFLAHGRSFSQNGIRMLETEKLRNNNQLHSVACVQCTVYTQPESRVNAQKCEPLMLAKPSKMRKQQNNLFGSSRKRIRTEKRRKGEEREREGAVWRRGGSWCVATLGALRFGARYKTFSAYIHK